MRVFILSINSGNVKRTLPVVTRCLVASLLLSHGIRKDAQFILYMPDIGKAVKFVGGTIRQLRADEQSASGILLKGFRACVEGRVRRGSIHPGVIVLDASRVSLKCSTYIKLGPEGKLLTVRELASVYKGDIAFLWEHDPCGDLVKLNWVPMRASVKFYNRPDTAFVIANILLDIVEVCGRGRS